MSDRSKRLSGWAVALLVAGALGFGASTLAATPASGATCLDDGWTFLGWQPTHQACYDACYALHAPNFTERYGPCWLLFLSVLTAPTAVSWPRGRQPLGQRSGEVPPTGGNGQAAYGMAPGDRRVRTKSA